MIILSGKHVKINDDEEDLGIFVRRSDERLSKDAASAHARLNLKTSVHCSRKKAGSTICSAINPGEAWTMPLLISKFLSPSV